MSIVELLQEHIHPKQLTDINTDGVIDVNDDALVTCW